jgi:replicative DNA helicase
VAYLAVLTDGLPGAINAEYYAKIIREKSRLRQLIKNCQETSVRCFEAEEQAEDIAIDLQNKTRKMIGSSSEITTGFNAIMETYSQISEQHSHKRKITGIPCGIGTLDEITTGFQPGDLIVLSAKTGYGKTALALNAMAHAMMYYDKKPIIFSLEMSKKQLCTRIISAYSEVDSWRLMTGYEADNEWDALATAADRLAACKFWIRDKSITIQELDSVCRRIAGESGIDLIVVDYLQLVTLGGKRKIENRTQEVTEVSRGLKAIATDLNIPVIALSQLNAEGEARESRAIEHDASLFITIEMEKEKLKTMEEVPAQIQIQKNRNGSLGTVDCIFKKRITKFI